MYKCSDCGKITKEKPQYCDCGNNIFVEVDPQADNAAVKPVSSAGKTSAKFTLPQEFDRLSVTIFVLCLIFSVIPWFFVLRQTPENENKHAIKPVEVKKDIPDFETLWDDTPVTAPAAEVPEQVVQQEEPQTIIEYVTQIVQVPRPAPKVVTPAPKVTQPKKEDVKTPAKPKTQTQNKPKTQNKPEVINRIEQKLSAKNDEQKKQQAKPAVSKTETKPQPPKPTAEELAALNLYRNNLRMVLLSKLNVKSIIGEGSCDIEFAIDPNGKLINRKFAKQSDNKSLNDAVYYMLMSVPVYQIPPKAYKGETIRLHFYINNGYYEISFK